MQTRTEPVPLVDLAFQHAEINAEIAEALSAAMTKGWRVEGDAAAQFEADFAAFCGRRHCVGVANGTDTILLTLRAAGIGAGDEVIVPANGRLAMVAAVLRAGARPVLADCDPQYHLLDPDGLRARLTLRTRAILAVHLYGQMAPVEDIAAVAGDRVVLFEDAAQSTGATRLGQAPGTWSRAVLTSFHPGMNLGAYGNGAAVLTDDDVLADRLRSLQPAGHQLDDGQAIVLLAKLRRLREWNARRAVTARLYRELLEDQDRIVLPAAMPGNEHVWHLYVVRVLRRNVVLAELHSAGIGAAVHYPVPIHLMPSCGVLGYRRGDFPHAEAAAAEILSLPIYPGIHPDEVERVVDALRRAVKG